MRAIVAPLLLLAIGCPASSESDATEPTRAPPPAATAPGSPEAARGGSRAGASDATPTGTGAAGTSGAPESADAGAGALLARPADALTARAWTLPGTAVELEFVPVTLTPRRGGVDGAESDVAERTLWVARTETTWDAYDVFVYGLDEPAPDAAEGADAIVRPSQPYVLADHGFGHAGFPVICVSAAGAEAFCAWLGARSGRRHRLPTEAEWQALCDAAHAGPSREALLDVAWLRDNSERATHAVGTRAPDALGLSDLLGNVTEWCRTEQGGHVARGGCWQDRALDTDCSARKVPSAAWNATDPQIPKSRWWLADAPFAGFRVVCDDAP